MWMILYRLCVCVFVGCLCCSVFLCCFVGFGLRGYCLLLLAAVTHGVSTRTECVSTPEAAGCLGGKPGSGSGSGLGGFGVGPGLTRPGLTRPGGAAVQLQEQASGMWRSFCPAIHLEPGS